MTTSAARAASATVAATTPPTSEAARAARAGSPSPDADLAQLGPEDAERFDLLTCLEPGADHGHDLHAFGRQPSRGDPAGRSRSLIRHEPAVQQERDGRAVPGIEDDHQPVERRRIHARESARHLHGVRRRASQVTRLHVDLATRLGNVEVDHARDLGTAGRVRDERGLDRVDAGRHRKRRAHVVVPQDPNARGHRAGASRADVPRVNPTGLGGSHRPR